jgi:hypothetical protein
MSKVLIVTPCSDRKYGFTPDHMRAASLSSGSLASVANEWSTRVNESIPTNPARDVYAGRSFLELKTAQSIVGADLAIISAGLGVVMGQQKIPNYGITVSRSAADSIFKKIEGKAQSSDWWLHLKKTMGAKFDLNSINYSAYDLVLMLMSKNYAKMVFGDLALMSEGVIKKVRVFGVGISPLIPLKLQDNILSYDQRLNGPDYNHPGTMTDLPARCLLDFCKQMQSNSEIGCDLQYDKEFVEGRLKGMRYPQVFDRKVCTDDEVKLFILQHWDINNGSVSKTLRLLRDKGFACEQARFANLFRSVRHEKKLQGEFNL